MNSRDKGKRGELLAKQYYLNKGFEILEESYRYKRAEIDLIADSNGELLVFVEVKFRKNRQFGEPESFVSEAQSERIKSAAEDYIMAINWQKDIRFDIVSIDKWENIEVFEDAF